MTEIYQTGEGYFTRYYDRFTLWKTSVGTADNLDFEIKKSSHIQLNLLSSSSTYFLRS